MMDHQLIILNYLVYKIIIKLNLEKKKRREGNMNYITTNHH